MKTADSQRGVAASLMDWILPTECYSPGSGKQQVNLLADVSKKAGKCFFLDVCSPPQKPDWDLHLSAQRIVFKDLEPLARTKAPFTILNKGSRPQRVKVFGDREDGLCIGTGSELAPEPVVCPLLPPGLSLRVHVDAPPFVGPAVLKSLTVKGSGRSVQVPVEALPPLMRFSCPSRLEFPPAFPGAEQQQLVPIANRSNYKIRVTIGLGQPLSSHTQKLLQQHLLHLAFHPQVLTLEPAASGSFKLVLHLERPGEIELPLSIVAKRLPKPPSSPRGSLTAPRVATASPYSSVRRKKKAEEPRLLKALAEWAGAGPLVEGRLQVHAFCTAPRWVLTLGDTEVKALDLGAAYCGEKRYVTLKATNLCGLPLALAFAASKFPVEGSRGPADEKHEKQQHQQEQQEQPTNGMQQPPWGVPQKSPRESGFPPKSLTSSRLASPCSQSNCRNGESPFKSDEERDACEAATAAPCVSSRRSSKQSCLSASGPCSCSSCCFVSSATDASLSFFGNLIRPEPPEEASGSLLGASPLLSVTGESGMPPCKETHQPPSSSNSREAEPLGGPLQGPLEKSIGGLALPDGLGTSRREDKLAVGGEKEASASAEAAEALSGQAEQHRPSRPTRPQKGDPPETEGRMQQKAPKLSRAKGALQRRPPHSAGTGATETPKADEGGGTKAEWPSKKKRLETLQRRAAPLNALASPRQQMARASAAEAPGAAVVVGGFPSQQGPGGDSPCQRKSAQLLPQPDAEETLQQQKAAALPAAVGPAAEALGAAESLRPLEDSASGDSLCQIEVTPKTLLLAPQETGAVVLRLSFLPCELQRGFRHTQAISAFKAPLAFQLHLFAFSAEGLAPLNAQQKVLSKPPFSCPPTRRQKPPKHSDEGGECMQREEALRSSSGNFLAPNPRSAVSTAAEEQSPRLSRRSEDCLTARPTLGPRKGRPIVARLRPATATARSPNETSGFFRDTLWRRSRTQPHHLLAEQEEASLCAAMQQQRVCLLAKWRGADESLKGLSSSSQHQRGLTEANNTETQKAPSPTDANLLAFSPVLRPASQGNRRLVRGDEGSSSASSLAATGRQPLGADSYLQVVRGHQVISGRCLLLLPFINISPNVLHFGECRVGQRRTKALLLTNASSQLPLDVTLHAPHPFRCQPATRQLLPKQQLAVQICFSPQRLGPVWARLKVSFCSRLYTRTVRLTGTASAPPSLAPPPST